MRVVVGGGASGIGMALVAMLREQGHPTSWFSRHGMIADGPYDAFVACNGSHSDPYNDCYWATRNALDTFSPKITVALSGGGVGGTPSLDVGVDYAAAKSGLATMVEWYALKHPDRQFFCVAPGLTATKMTGYKGADPRIPAAFIVKLLSGKYGHLSGSLLAAQRDDLDTMKPMKLRRVECP